MMFICDDGATALYTCDAETISDPNLEDLDVDSKPGSTRDSAAGCKASVRRERRSFGEAEFRWANATCYEVYVDSAFYWQNVIT